MASLRPDYQVTIIVCFCYISKFNKTETGVSFSYLNQISLRYKLLTLATYLNGKHLFSGCKKDVKGEDYQGTTSVTMNGKTCQAWSSNTPHAKNPKASDNNNYPDGSMADAKNYCRNPDGSNHVWCYTTDPNVRWEKCDIPICSSMYDLYLYNTD